MDPFLKQVAQYYYQEFGSEISKLAFVFPSKRATLFFRRYLGSIVGKPILSPSLCTISDFFLSMSPLKVKDRTALLFDLYKCYTQLHSSPLSFDEFLFWGEIILRDFNEVDRYLVKAEQLYSNLVDFKALEDDYSFLSENQVAAIKSFWQSFELGTKPNDGCQNKFLEFWQMLYPLYKTIKEKLQNEGYAYEGMVYRDLAESIRWSEAIAIRQSMTKELSQANQIVFVGLFALSPAEETILSRLQKEGIARFCWDYDLPIINNDHPEINKVIRSNIELLGRGDDWKSESASYEQEKQGPHIELIRCNSEVAQAKALPQLIEKYWQGSYSNQKALNTAIVLPDTKMLMPTLGSVTNTSKHINVTMGYPLTQSNIVLWANKWMELQLSQRFYNKEAHIQVSYAVDLLAATLAQSFLNDSLELLKKELQQNKRYFYPCNEMLRDDVSTLLFSPISSGHEMLERLLLILERIANAISDDLLCKEESSNALESIADKESDARLTYDPQSDTALLRLNLEYIFYYRRELTKLLALLNDYKLEVEPRSAKQLINGLLATVNLSFEGEPLLGLQIMGLLETRSLEFENLIILSTGEGNLPKLRIDSTLIPYTLRRGYALPIGEVQDAIQAYHFFRLIGHAKNLALLYNARAGSSGGAEESRYIRQIDMLHNYPICKTELKIDGRKAASPPRAISKDAHIMQILSRYYTDSTIEELPDGHSPSMLSASAINRYIECPLSFYYQYVLQLEEDKDPDPLMEASEFGTVLHNSIEKLYSPFIDKVIQKENLESFLVRGNQQIERCVIQIYSEVYLHATEPAKLSGLDHLYCNTIAHYIRRLIQHDIKLCPFSYLHSEVKTYGSIELSNGKIIGLKGTIDRVDLIQRQGSDYLRVVDYKTGNVKMEIGSWEKLFSNKHSTESKTLVQTLLYCYLLKQERAAKGRAIKIPIQPCVYDMRQLFTYQAEANEFGIVKVGVKKNKQSIIDYNEVEETYTEGLRHCLDEIFNPDLPFVETIKAGNDGPCDYCQFNSICGNSNN